MIFFVKWALRKSIFALLMVFFLFSHALADEFRCGGGLTPEMQLPIHVSFTDPSLRTIGIFESLQPRLKLRDQTFRSAHLQIIGQQERAIYTFCIGPVFNDTQHAYRAASTSPAKLLVGLAEYEFSLDRDTVGAFTSSSTAIGHDPIAFLDMPNPNWIIPLDARVLKTSEGDQVFALTLYNPHAQGLFGPSIGLKLSRPSAFFCAVAGPTSILDLTVVVDQFTDEFLVSSSEIELGISVIRPAIFSSNTCAPGDRLSVDLGYISAIPPNEVRKFFWKLDVASVGETRKSTGSRLERHFAKASVSNLLSLLEDGLFSRKVQVFFEFEGVKIWPKSLKAK